MKWRHFMYGGARFGSFEAERWLAAIVDDAFPDNGRKRRYFVVGELAVGQDMPHAPSADGQMV